MNLNTPDGSTHNFGDIIRRELAEDESLQAGVESESAKMEAAELVFEARSRANLTQAQLAARIGTTQSVIARLEDADYDGHSLKMLRKVAEACGYTLRLELHQQS